MLHKCYQALVKWTSLCDVSSDTQQLRQGTQLQLAPVMFDVQQSAPLIWCLHRFPRYRCCGQKACVRCALGGERLHGGVCGTTGQWLRRVSGSAGSLLYHSSPEGGAPRRWKLCQSQRHFRSSEDTCTGLAAGGGTESGGGRLSGLCIRLSIYFPNIFPTNIIWTFVYYHILFITISWIQRNALISHLLSPICVLNTRPLTW